MPRFDWTALWLGLKPANPFDFGAQRRGIETVDQRSAAPAETDQPGASQILQVIREAGFAQPQRRDQLACWPLAAPK
jgi:hypothetical protein